jgi:predicted nuclease of predicted toxin-antitoxin system
MRFLCDMGVSLKVTQWLREQGHEATHLREEGLQTLPNGEIFAKALSEGRVLLTFDLDFGEIAAFSRDVSIGVIVFRLRNARASQVTNRLSTLFEESTDAIRKGAIIIVEDARHRIRYLPIGGDDT